MTNFRRTADWLAACGKEPLDERALSVQIGCHISEFVEFLEQVEAEGSRMDELVTRSAVTVLSLIADEAMKGNCTLRLFDREAALDALCDTEVTGNGVAYLAGFRKEQADLAVLASNEAKLVNGKPVIREGGKIGKPEGWTPPDLSDCV